MDSIYFINSCATVIYGFFFGMSFMWWVEYYLYGNSNKKEINDIYEIRDEIKFMNIQLDIFKAKLTILEKEHSKRTKNKKYE
jgi:hypothetical protein